MGDISHSKIETKTSPIIKETRIPLALKRVFLASNRGEIPQYPPCGHPVVFTRRWTVSKTCHTMKRATVVLPPEYLDDAPDLVSPSKVRARYETLARRIGLFPNLTDEGSSSASNNTFHEYELITVVNSIYGSKKWNGSLVGPVNSRWQVDETPASNATKPPSRPIRHSSSQDRMRSEPTKIPDSSSLKMPKLPNRQPL